MAEAAQAAAAMQRKTGRQFSAYHCSFCGRHHTGHAIPRRKTRQREAFAGTGPTMAESASTSFLP